MTAHELARLLLYGPDVTVYVDGYEGGVEDVTPSQVWPARVARGAGHGAYCGDHRELYHDEPDVSTMEHGIIISRRRRA